MQSKGERKTLGVLPLIIAVVMVAAGALIVANNSVWSIMRADAEANAHSWGSFLFDDVPAIDDVIAGRVPLENAVAYMWGRNEFGTLKRFRVYDKTGIERMDSAQVDFRPIRETTSPNRNPTAAKVFAENESDFTFHDDVNEQIVDDKVVRGHTYTAHTLVPLIQGDKAIGVLEVISDETDNWKALRSKFEWAGIQIIGLVVLAFMLPGFLYMRRTGQLEFTTNRLRHTVEYDALTGTLNRSAFTSLLREQISGANAHGLSVAVHFIDLDRFKNINDALGHAVGDQLLAATAQRLRRVLGTRERLARLGADEFAIMQPFHPSATGVVEQFGHDIVHEMARAFFIDGSEIQIGATVGYAVSPKDGETVDEIIRAADIALAHAKSTARGEAEAFDPSMEAERQVRQHIEARLRHALAHHQFDINYQPLYNIDGKELRGFEALLRLKDEQGKPISPEIFIPIAEEMGLIGAIGHWVLEQSARTAREWSDDLIVSVNLSPLQFQTHDMPQVVKSVLEQTGLPAHRLELEVTEGVLIIDTDKVLTALREIKDLGVSIALDDFGTGYSSLAYLWSFPFDKLKVDKSFMTDLAVEGSKSREILATIVALGKVLDLKITAEGVETKEQIEVLRALDCDLVQGFLYGKPLDSDALASLLTDRVQKEAMERASQRLQHSVGKASVVRKLA